LLHEGNVMGTVPRIGVRPRGRYVNIDADDIEIGYLTVTSNGRIDVVWAYDYGNRWLVEVACECYRAALTAIPISSAASR